MSFMHHGGKLSACRATLPISNNNDIFRCEWSGSGKRAVERDTNVEDTLRDWFGKIIDDVRDVGIQVVIGCWKSGAIGEIEVGRIVVYGGEWLDYLNEAADKMDRAYKSRKYFL